MLFVYFYLLIIILLLYEKLFSREAEEFHNEHILYPVFFGIPKVKVNIL